MNRAPRWLPAAIIAAVAAPIYLWQLGAAPTFGGDEARFAAHAHELAITGHDLNGTSFPLLFRINEYSWWWQPGLFYAMAAVLKVAPLSEWSARLPMALAGVLNVFLIYFVARQLLGSARYAAMAAIGLALTPAHLIFSRQALDYMLPMPFTLGWLVCLLILLERPALTPALAAGALLGLSVYTHFSAWAMAPMYFVLSIGALLWAGRSRTIAPFVVAVSVVLIPLALWLLQHPGFATDAAMTYRLYDSRRFSTLQGAREILNWNGIETRLATYWDYLNPGYLFMSGGASLTAATRRAGVFPLAFVVFIPCGLAYLWQNRRLPAAWIVIAGFFTAPLAVSVIGTRYLIQRELFVLPFGVLIATFGAAWLLARPHKMVRIAAIALLVSVPIQFVSFYRDYLGDYVTRSAFWFDPGSFAQSSAYVSGKDTSAVPQIWISDALDDGMVHWPFEMRKRGRADLLGKSYFFAADRHDLGSMAAGSLLLLQHNDASLPRFVGDGQCCAIDAYLNGADGNRSVVVLLKR